MHAARTEFHLHLIEHLLTHLIFQGRTIMSTLDDLEASVANTTTVEASAVVLLQNLSALITASAGDPAALAALAGTLTTNANALADAVTANTPAAVVPPVV